MQFATVTTLLIGAMLLLLGGRLARRRKIDETFGFSLTLCLIALGLALIPNSWEMWPAGGEAGDRVLTIARELGLTGLFFLAGARFDVTEVWMARRLSLFVTATGALFLILIAIMLTVLGEQDRGVVFVTAAAIAGTSLWLPGRLSLDPRGDEAIAAASAKGAAAVLAALSTPALYLYTIFHGQAGRHLSASAYTIVVLYELVKVMVSFSFAWFAATKFLDRAEGRIPPVRRVIGYLLIAALIFTLSRSLIGPLGGVAWSFIAGTIFVRNELGKRLLETRQSVMAAALLSFAFLPLLLQSHGRVLTGKTLVFSLIIAALTFKFVMVWAGTWVAGVSGTKARRIAAATLASGEMGILLLSFGVTQWAIDGRIYFGILAYAFISMFLSAMPWRFATGKLSAGKQDSEAQASGGQHRNRKQSFQRAVTAITIIWFGLLAPGSIGYAQSPATPSGDDPVARAAERIRAAVDDRVKAADRALAASRLVKESEEAKKQGDTDRARDALEQAEKLIAEDTLAWRSHLIEELLRQVAGERTASNSKSVATAFAPLPIGRIAGIIPRPVLARYREYRDPLGRILIDEQVPVELLAVALIESGFNALALSPKGARGIWQLMPATAERYGLAVTVTDDHRTHPEHSTRAAARYLRDLYRQFGDWKLALAAYNWGESNVQRMIAQTGVRDFDRLAQRGLLPLETRKYVPAVLAVWAQLSDNRGASQ